MSKLLTILFFVLSLYGCDIGSSTFLHRITGVDGDDALYSQVQATAGVARFECPIRPCSSAEAAKPSPDCEVPRPVASR